MLIINFLDLGINTNNVKRAKRLIDSILSIPENELNALYEEIKKNFFYVFRASEEKEEDEH